MGTCSVNHSLNIIFIVEYQILVVFPKNRNWINMNFCRFREFLNDNRAYDIVVDSIIFFADLIR